MDTIAIQNDYEDFLVREQKEGRRHVTESDFRKQPEERDAGYRVIEGIAEKRGSVLIFVPGMLQIERIHDAFEQEFDITNSNRCKLRVFPLHSDIVV